jgi:signal transduction histidine kinase
MNADLLRGAAVLDKSKFGSGLGLSIVLELAPLYGGGLTLSNPPVGGLGPGARQPMGSGLGSFSVVRRGIRR